MTRPRRSSGGPPAWLVFLVGVALVFGLYYLWIGLRDFLRTGGLGVVEATERAVIVATATAQRVRTTPTPTLRPSFTPVPPCQDFVVSVPNAIVRQAPSTNSPIVTAYFEGTVVCVVGRDPDNAEWYIIDNNPQTRRLDAAYMHQSVIRAVNPTPTPSYTPTPLPTVTPTPTDTPTITPSPQPTPTRDPRLTDTPTPTLSPTPTVPLQSA